MQSFWNERYSQPEYAYGKAPNAFFREQISALTPGRLLLPAEGEGRNGVFAAGMGWQVSAFDYSTAAKEKALLLAKEQGVSIDYITADIDALPYEPASFDVIALIFAHFPAGVKHTCHKLWDHYLKPGGMVILEAFSKDHIRYNADGKAGGPRDVDMLYDTSELLADFPGYEILLLDQIETHLSEGLYHNGLSSVVRFVAKKPAPGQQTQQ